MTRAAPRQAGPSWLIDALFSSLLSPVWCDPCVASGVLLVLAAPVASAMTLRKHLPERAGQRPLPALYNKHAAKREEGRIRPSSCAAVTQ